MIQKVALTLISFLLLSFVTVGQSAAIHHVEAARGVANLVDSFNTIALDTSALANDIFLSFPIPLTPAASDAILADFDRVAKAWSQAEVAILNDASNIFDILRPVKVTELATTALGRTLTPYAANLRSSNPAFYRSVYSAVVNIEEKVASIQNKSSVRLDKIYTTIDQIMNAFAA